jgi:hypothetical protein
VEKLWGFAAAAYLDNPIPTLFKERLFVFLSRFCPVRYCIVRHCGFLIGYGAAAGDPAAHTQTIEQMIELLQTPPPWRRDLEPIYRSLAAMKTPVDWPAPGSEIEDQLFALCTLIFVNPTQSERARNALRQALGGKRFEYVLSLLACKNLILGLRDRDCNMSAFGTKRTSPSALHMSAFDPWAGRRLRRIHPILVC